MFYANGQIGDGDVGDIKSGMWTTAPYGWLLCDGSTYDTTKYSKLYSYLGTNKLPDLRECVLVGAGQSDNEYDANSNPTGIQAHDIYTVGQFKDDQFQGHRHSLPGNSNEGWSTAFENRNPRGTNYSGGPVSWDSYGAPRYGTTTHGKQIGVNYCIKY